MRILLIVSILIFSFSINNAQNWQQCSGPYGGYILSISMHPQDQNILYAGTRGGDLYKTTTGGNEWFKVYSFGSNIGVLAIDKSNPNTIYVGTESGGLFQSFDSGKNWNNISPTSKPISSILIDPKNNSIIYIGTDGSGIFKSTDKGSSWSLVTVGLSDDQINSLEIDPNDSQVLYAGSDYRIYKSQSGGLTWSNLYTTYSKVTSIIVDQNNTSNIYIGTMKGVFRSIDKGGSWNEINNGLNNKKVNMLVMSSLNSSILYAATEGGLFKSITGGSSWTINFTPPGQTIINTICINAFNNNILYAGCDGDGLFKTVNSGNNWQMSNIGITNMNVWKIVADQYHSNIIYAGTEVGGVFKSTDCGKTWELVKQLKNVYTLAIDNTNSNIIYAGTYGNGIYKSVDGGKSWGQFNNGLSNTQVWDISIDPSNPAVLYVATDDGIYKSADKALNWIKAYSPFLSRCYSVTVDPNNSNIVYMGTGTYDGCVKKSINGGSTWNTAAKGINFENIFALKVVPGNPKVVFAGGVSSGLFAIYSGLYSLPEGTSRWIKNIDNFYTSEITYNPKNPSEIYASSFNSGIYRTTDGGNSWNIISNKVPYSVSDAVCFDSNKVYAAFRYAGIWQTTSVVTEVENWDFQLNHNFLLSQNYPNPFNPITTIKYSIPKTSFVTLKVYDVLGREITTLVNEEKSPGNYEVQFDGSNLSSGVYFYTMQAGNFVQTKKLLLIK